jgi:hypothetical protein
MSTLYRAQLLLEREQHQALAEIAKEEGRSISEVVREALGPFLAERSKEARKRKAKQALEELTALRKQIEAKRGVLPGDFIEQMREERDEELWRVMRGEP